MADKKKLKVKIFDKEYSLLVEDEELAKDLAEYVDNVIEETRQELPDHVPQTVAIIASLNIAYDFYLEKSKSKDYLIQASDKINRIKLLLNQPDLYNP